jgi:NodT family efflux transporter outer membrane factor (OMF) lipoprotein
MKAAVFLSSVLVALALLNACNLAPSYQKPAVQTPAAFKETNGWKQAQPRDAVLKGKWWESFNDPALNQLEERVAISNQNIAAALENFMAARAVVKQARSAYYPTLGVAPSVAKARQPNLNSSSSTTYTTYDLPAEASWEPDLWGSVRNTVRAAAYTAQASAATLENMRLSAQAELAVDYFSLRGQDQMIRVFDDTVRAYEESVSLTKTLYETGIDSQLDEAQAEALLETVKAQAEALAIQRAQYEHAIALLLGQPASAFSLPAATNVTVLPPVPVGLPSALLERRPDIAAAERAVAVANAQIGVARAAYYPTLSLTGSAGYESTSLSSLISPPSFFWSVGSSLSETILDFGRRKGANEQALANYRSTVAGYRQTVLTAFQQVEDNLAALRILSVETAQQDRAVQASQKSLDLSTDRYRLGVASYLNVITAQETLLGNQQTAVNIRTQQYTSSVQLILALGGGWSSADLPSTRKLILKSQPDGNTGTNSVAR